MQLPSIGHITDANAPEAMQYVSLLVKESAEENRQPIQLANESVYIYGYGRAEDDDTDPFVNEIQNAVIAATDVQTKDPIQITLEPVETGEPAQTFWAGPEDVARSLGIPEEFITGSIDPTTFEQQPPQPLPEQYAEQLKALAQPKEMYPALMPSAENPVPIRPEWLVDLDDRLVADVYQGVFDVHWMRCDADYWVDDNLLDNNVQGWSYGLYQFSDDAQRHVLEDLPLSQVHIDPTARDISKAAYAGFDRPMDASEAKRQYPLLAKEIDEAAVDGTPSLIDGGMMRWGAAYDRNFRRKMVVFRVMWIRNQPLPLDKDEAVALGILEERQVPDESMAQEGGAEAPYADVLPEPAAAQGEDAEQASPPGPDEVGAGEDGGTDSGDAVSGVDDSAVAEDDSAPDSSPLGGPGDGDDLASIEQAVTAEQTGGDSGAEPAPLEENNYAPEPAAIVPMRMACFLTGTDEEVTPDDARWPVRLVLGQFTQLGNKVVAWQEAEFSDIPILHNQNIPMTGSRPWGMGEPYRLKDAQSALNRTIAAMVKNADFFAHPMTVLSEYTVSKLPEEYRDGRAEPGMSITVPDDVYRMTGGKIDTLVLPPPMNEAHTFLAPYLEQIIQQNSGNTEVLQGRANSQVKSGVAINLLQSAATSLIGFKSKRTGRMVRYMAKLMLHSLVMRLETPDLAKIVSKYPPHVLDAIRHRALELEWNVLVRVESATGGSQMQKRQEALQDLQLGAIGKQSYREKVGLDDRVEEQRLEGEQQKMARMQMMVAPPAQEGEKAEGEKKPPAAA